VVSAAYNEVARIHERGPVDVVVGPLWLCEGLVGSLDERFPTVLTLMTSLRTIAGIHPSWANDERTRQSIALEAATARTAKHVHAISAAILDKVRTDYGIDPDDVVVAPLGIRDRSGDFRSRRTTDDGRLQVLFVGRMERRKGVDLLLQAAERFVGDYPHVDFILAGKDTPNTETGTTYREAFTRAHARESEILRRVRFTGAVTEAELYQLYADADVFCLPSRYESFGLVLLEAMMFGKPVVACAAGGMNEIVEVGGNGLLAEPGDAASLERCLRQVIEDDALRHRFGRRSRALFVERYSSDRMVENALHYYGAVAASRRTGAATAGERRQQLTEAFARVIVETTGASGRNARRLAATLLTPPPVEVEDHRPPMTRLERWGARFQSVPFVKKLLRYATRVLTLPGAIHRLQIGVVDMQHNLRMLAQEQHREVRELLAERGREEPLRRQRDAA
jgi:glycosyltransferase involved in cell wall biosynthesis